MTDIDENANLGETTPVPAAPDAAPASNPAASATANQGESPAVPSQEGPADAKDGDEPPRKFQESPEYRRLQRQRGSAERRAARAEAQIADLQRQLQEVRKTPAPGAELRPQDFPTYDAYVAATAKNEAKAAAREEVEAGLRSRIEQATASSAQQRKAAFIEKAAPDAEAAGIDIEEIMDELSMAPMVSQTVANYLFDKSERPAQLAEYLAENPAELDRISRINTPALAERSLAKLEARFAAPKARPSVTKAPAPGPTVSGRAVHHGDWRQSNDMDDYATNWHKEREARGS